MASGVPSPPPSPAPAAVASSAYDDDDENRPTHMPPVRAVFLESEMLVSWEENGGVEMESILCDGAIALLDAHWLVEEFYSGDSAPLPRRQELPDEAFVSLDELKSFGSPVGGGGLPICVVSCPWLTTDHPDPFRTSLEQLTRMLRHMVGNGQRWGVFWDFFSLHQRPLKGKRPAEEDVLFARSQGYMGPLYSHPSTTVCRVTRLPADYPDGEKWQGVLSNSANKATYESRGWCFVEWRWSKFAGKDPSRSLDVGRLSGEEDDRKAAVAVATTECTTEPASLGNGRLEPPLTPEEFKDTVDLLAFSFPKDDGGTVQAMYAASYVSHLGGLRRLDLSNAGWGDEEAEQLARVISSGAFTQLSLLYLDRNSIGQAGFAAIALAISEGGAPKLTRCVVERNQASGDSVLKSLRRLHAQLAAGVKPTAAAPADADAPKTSADSPEQKKRAAEAEVAGGLRVRGQGGVATARSVRYGEDGRAIDLRRAPRGAAGAGSEAAGRGACPATQGP